jgi:hypothetical protein
MAADGQGAGSAPGAVLALVPTATRRQQRRCHGHMAAAGITRTRDLLWDLQGKEVDADTTLMAQIRDELAGQLPRG